MTALLVLGAGVWFTRHFDPEVARLIQQKAKQRLERERVSYLSVEASGRDLTVVLPPGAPPSAIAVTKALLANLEGASSIDVHAFGESRHDDRLRKIFPKERLAAAENTTPSSAGKASEFPTPEAPAPGTVRRKAWNLSIGRSAGGHVEVFDLGATE